MLFAIIIVTIIIITSPSVNFYFANIILKLTQNIKKVSDILRQLRLNFKISLFKLLKNKD
jgi:hypothetical protein